jgi:predicted metal-binding membrane protein
MASSRRNAPPEPARFSIGSLIRRERTIVAVALALIVALAWLHVLAGAGTGMSVMHMSTWRFPPPLPAFPAAAEWSLSYAALMVAMWWVMMVAMMLPSAAPMLLLHARVVAHAEKQGHDGPALGQTGGFLAGYLLVWLGFSLVATVAQWLLEFLGIVDGMLMWSTSRGFSAALLIAAGAWQLTPWKSVCLDHCRRPAEFLSAHWRKGTGGALRMGLEHGAWCVGCCWMLMALLFVGGAMNLFWIAGLSAIVLAEKLLPGWRWLSSIVGAILIASGLWLGSVALH